MKNFCKKLILLFALAAFVLPACTKKPNTTTPPVVGTGQTLKDADGNGYDTVIIGTQVWMVQNLKTTHYRDGTPIVNVTVDTTWQHLTTGAYSDYDNTPSNSATYGRLYNWYATTSSHNICPKGWHVPSDAEWASLVSFLGDSAVAGGKLKETGTTHWLDPNTAATNVSGFSALPGGGRFSSGMFSDIGVSGNWWSSTQDNTIDAWGRGMGYGSSVVFRLPGGKSVGLSVRCIRD